MLTLGVCSAQSCPCVTSFHPHAHSLQEAQSTPVTQQHPGITEVNEVSGGHTSQKRPSGG